MKENNCHDCGIVWQVWKSETYYTQAEIKKLRDALKETLLYMREGELEARKRGTCYIDILHQAEEALKEGD